MGDIPNLLKAFVIAGGVALIAGTALLVGLIVARGHREVGREPPAAIDLPAGAHIQQVAVDGSRWLLLGSAGDGRQFLAVIDPRSGKATGLLWLRPEDRR